jgi:hypothetical protein
MSEAGFYPVASPTGFLIKGVPKLGGNTDKTFVPIWDERFFIAFPHDSGKYPFNQKSGGKQCLRTISQRDGTTSVQICQQNYRRCSIRRPRNRLPEFLNVLFPMSLIEQEMSQERCIDIPEEVREIYKLCRPSPLFCARRLEKFQDITALIYFKNEGVSIYSSHKRNTAVPQAYYNMIDGTKALTMETGAVQWGSTLAIA